MPLKIKVINEEKKWVIPKKYNSDGDSYLVYKGVNNRDVLNKLKKIEFRGKIDIGQIEGLNIILEMIDNYVVGWGGIVDETGKEIEFNKDLIKSLPLEIQIKFVEDILLPVWYEIIDMSGTSTNLTSKKEKEELEN